LPENQYETIEYDEGQLKEHDRLKVAAVVWKSIHSTNSLALTGSSEWLHAYVLYVTAKNISNIDF